MIPNTIYNLFRISFKNMINIKNMLLNLEDYPQSLQLTLYHTRLICMCGNTYASIILLSNLFINNHIYII